MPDGTVVNMPDQLDPVLGARLRGFMNSVPKPVAAADRAPGLSPAESAQAFPMQATHPGFQPGRAIGDVGNAAALAAASGGTSLVNILSKVLGVDPAAVNAKLSGLLGKAGAPIQPNADVAKIAAGAAGSMPAQAVGAALHGVDTAAGAVGPRTQQVVRELGSDVGDIANVAGATGAMLPGASAAAPAAAAGEVAAAPEWAQAGFRSAESHPFAAGVAGPGGTQALTLHNQQIANVVNGAEAAVPHGTPLSYDALEAGRAAPNAVHARVAAALPTAPLSPAAAAAVNNVGVNNLVTHTPDAQAIIEAQRQRLLAGPMTGNEVVSNMSALRHEGYARIGSDDVEQQNIGRAQLDFSRALQQHVADTLPPNANVSMDQLQQARVALAKNQAVQSALHGSNVDPQALARMQRADPGLLTGGLKATADFANEHPAVSGLANKIEVAPGLVNDLGKAAGGGSAGIESLISPGFYTRVFGGKAAARRVLTGDTGAAVQAAQARYPGASADQLAPIEHGPPQPPPGMTASTPTAPPAAPGGPPGGISLADLLAHGVEQAAPQGLSLAPGAPVAPAGIPFQQNAAHMAGGLTLADELAPRRAGASNADLAGVMSQGVPEGIAQRTPGGIPIAHEADELGNHTVTSPNGAIHAQENGPYLQVKRSDVAPGARGQGEASAMMERLAQEASDRGLSLASDVSVSPDARRLYAGMQKRGFNVVRNPSTLNPSTNNFVSADPRKPVFVVTPQLQPLGEALGGAR